MGGEFGIRLPVRRGAGAGRRLGRGGTNDPAATVAALAGAVVHAAAIVAERGRMEDFIRVNVRGTRNVLDAAGPRRTFVIASVAGWGCEFARARRGRAAPGTSTAPARPPWVIRPLVMMRSPTPATA